MAIITQVALDVTTIQEALEIARGAVHAGVDWLEAGTPLILGEGLRSVRALREAFPEHTIVADLKTMDGGGLETEMMAQAGADVVVVMAVSHVATVRATVQMARRSGIKVMGDIMAAPDKVAAAKMLEAEGIDYVIVHTGYDERHLNLDANPLDDLPAILDAVDIPVQAVGGLSIDQAVEAVRMGAELFVIGAPLVIDDQQFTVASDTYEEVLREIVGRVKALE